LINLAVPTFALVGTIIGLKSLTTVFGMGTGVTFSVCSPEKVRRTVRHGALRWFGCKSGRKGRSQKCEVRSSNFCLLTFSFNLSPCPYESV
jgi:hypothetical protein